jgi:hypothetical protein
MKTFGLFVGLSILALTGCETAQSQAKDHRIPMSRVRRLRSWGQGLTQAELVKLLGVPNFMKIIGDRTEIVYLIKKDAGADSSNSITFAIRNGVVE